MALDPDRFYIVVVAMLGNGQSSSPSNTHQLCNHLQIKKLHTVIGWSMGAGQSYQWAVSYPEMVERCIPFCGSAKTAEHNITFLRSLESTLQLDPVFNRGWYDVPPQEGLRAFARIYSAWGFSQSFYRERLYIKMGFPTLESFLIGFWEDLFLKKDANNLLSMLFTWINGDISASPAFSGDFEKSLKSIKAKTLILPSQTDLYFPPEDNHHEASHILDCEIKVIPSIWGHFAGG
ncbi:Alpha/Beta hydrolase protein [Melampsora americana]|nr:Alpha/Beta hydrolase protein [Melampsora americana]